MYVSNTNKQSYDENLTWAESAIIQFIIGDLNSKKQSFQVINNFLFIHFGYGT